MTPPLESSAPSLAEKPAGSRWRLAAIEGEAVLVERLYEIGFLPGETIQLHGRVPLGGPWLIEVRGMTVALRENEIRCLRI
jgi:Fe2+ transport system protein FeoA